MYQSKLPWDDGEIVRSWINSGKAGAQIKILAELNACTPARIEEVLRSAGYYKPKRARRGRAANNPWTAEGERLLIDMRVSGCAWKEIAARVGHSAKSCKSHVYSGNLYNVIAEKQRALIS